MAAAGGLEERIRISAIIATQGLDKLDKITKKVNNVGRRLAKQQKFINREMSGGAQQLINNAIQTNNLGKRYDSFGKTMSMPFKKWKQFNEEGGKFDSLGGRIANKFRMATHGLRGFRMEMLSIMFFGMNLQRFFIGLLKPVMELTGLTELWSTTLQMVFLPIGMALLDFLMPFMMWLMNLSDSTKLLIGKLVILGAVLGVFLFLFGTLSLAIGGMIMAFGGLFMIIDKLIPDIHVLGVNLSSITEAALGITLVKGLFSALKIVVGGLLGTLLGLPFVSALLDNLGVDIGENETAWESLKRVVKTVMDKIKEKLGIDEEMGIIEGLIDEVSKSANTWLDDMKTKMDELGVTDLIDSFKDLGTTAVDLAPDLNEIADALTIIAKTITTIHKIITAPSRFVSKLQEKVSEYKLKKSFFPGDYYRGGSKFDDFIWRPGSAPVSVSPNDTLIGTKGGIEFGTNVTINPVYNINVSDRAEFERMMDANNKNLVDDVKRMIGA